MLFVHCEGDHIADWLDDVEWNHIQGGEGVKVYLMLLETVSLVNTSSGRVRHIPERTNARDILGARTISSTGFSFGIDCLERRVYESGWALCE